MFGSWTIEKISIGQKGVDIVWPKSINTTQFPIISNANNEQTPNIWVAVGKSAKRARYSVIYEISKSSGRLRR